jgi:membrane fusion protein
VRKGERLLALSSEVQSAALGATQTEIARRLHERRRSLQQQRDQHARLVAQQERNLGERIRTLGREQQQLGQEIALQRARVGIAEQDVTRQRALRKQGFVSDAGLQQAQAARIEQAGRLATLERDRSAKARERLALEAELDELPFKAQAESAALEREIGELEQQLATTEARREVVLVAPHDGVVTALLAETGGQAATSSPLLSIVPPGAKLQGHLYSPSRAIGFVQPGQRVWLRYEPFPYQKFGHQEAVVTSVSRSPLSPAELPPQLSGVLAAAGSKDPVYRVTVELRSQTIRAYGADIALQPGTQLDADIALERRRLYEWVLEPLYTLSGTWQS